MVEKTRANSILGLAVAWIAALGCMGSTLHAKWLNFPISKLLRGTQYSLGSYSGHVGQFVPWSFGCLAAVLMLASALAFSFRLWRWLAAIGCVLLWLTFFGAFKPALTSPRLLQALGTEFTQQQSAYLFTQQAMPVNYGTEPSVWTQLDLSSIEARLIAGWYFVHFGWWAALLGGGIALGYGAARERTPLVPGVAGLGLVVMFLVCALGPARAERALMRGHDLEARGDYDGAAQAYRAAMRLDGWQALAINTYSAIGGLDAARGRHDTVEYHVYHAQLASTQMDLPLAVAELRSARAVAGGTTAEVIRKRESELYTLYARALHSLSAYGAAVTASRNALECDPSSLLPAYYLAREAYLIGQYSEAAAISDHLLLRVDDPTIRANLFANIGDAYTQLGDYAGAKLAYRSSYQFDYVLNLRALSALNGPGRDLQ